MATTLELDKVRKSYSGAVAVDNLSLSIPRGTIFGLLGPNGAGKTSTIRMMIGILVPDSGMVRIFGSPLSRAGMRRVGYLPEERGLYRKMTVSQNLSFLGALARLPARERRNRALKWCQRLEIANALDRRVEELSKGNQQKVQIIAALLHDPDFIVMDEPFAGLDPINAAEIKDVMIELKRAGRTILLSTHRMDQAEKLCDEICFINRGKAVFLGDLRQARAEAGRRSIAIELENSAAFLACHPTVERFNDFGNYAEVILRPGADSQELLREAMARARVLRFEVREPSLEEIFITLVGNRDG